MVFDLFAVLSCNNLSCLDVDTFTLMVDTFVDTFHLPLLFRDFIHFESANVKMNYYVSEYSFALYLPLWYNDRAGQWPGSAPAEYKRREVMV